MADDLTGAGDVGLAFHAAGFEVEIAAVATAGTFPGRPSPGADVWVLDTESRHLPPAAAARRVAGAAKVLRRWKAAFYYKKIDSTLRGNLSSECAAFFRVFGIGKKTRCAFVPAFPRMGRVTRGGAHFVDGVPLQKSAFGRDPRRCVRSGRVRDAVGEGLRPLLWVPDIESQRDLERAARNVVNGEGVCSFAAVGSAGLAEALAKLVPGTGPGRKLRIEGQKSLVRVQAPRPRSLVLVVAGSAHPKTREQLERLRGSKAALAAVVLSAPQKRGLPSRVMRALASCGQRVARLEGVDRMAVTGGETAYALCRRWKRFRWRILKPIGRGMPLCLSTERKPFWMALKPGGFGEKDALVKAVQALAQQ